MVGLPLLSRVLLVQVGVSDLEARDCSVRPDFGRERHFVHFPVFCDCLGVVSQDDRVAGFKEAVGDFFERVVFRVAPPVDPKLVGAPGIVDRLVLLAEDPLDASEFAV